MKKLLTLALFLTLSPAISFSGQRKLLFFEQKLIITPQEQAAYKLNMCKKLVYSIGLATTVSYLIDYGIKCFIDWDHNRMRLLPTNRSDANAQRDIEYQRQDVKYYFNCEYFPPKFIPVLSLLIYFFIHKGILNRIKNQHIVKFIAEWRLNQQYTPKELHLIFNKLHTDYNALKTLDQSLLKQISIRYKKLAAKYKENHADK